MKKKYFITSTFVGLLILIIICIGLGIYTFSISPYIGISFTNINNNNKYLERFSYDGTGVVNKTGKLVRIDNVKINEEDLKYTPFFYSYQKEAQWWKKKKIYTIF